MTALLDRRYLAQRLAVILFAFVFAIPASLEGQRLQESGGSDLQQLIEALTYQIELSKLSNKPEYRRRRQALAAGIQAWNASAQTAVEKDAFKEWLHASIRYSMPGASRRLPTLPELTKAAVPPSKEVSASSVPLPAESESPASVDLPVTQPSEKVAIEPKKAKQLWDDSPADVDLQLEKLLAEAAEQDRQRGDDVKDRDWPEAEIASSSEPAPQPLVDRPRRVVGLTEATVSTGELPELELIAIAEVGETATTNRLEMINVNPAPVTRQAPRVATRPSVLAGSPEKLVTTLRPNTDSVGETSGVAAKASVGRGDSGQTADQQESSPVDIAKLTAKVESYNRRLRRIEKLLTTESMPTAFQLGNWAEELEVLGRQRQFVQIYQAAVSDERPASAPDWQSAELAISTLREQVIAREELIGDLPDQAVRAERVKLQEVGDMLPQLVEGHK